MFQLAGRTPVRLAEQSKEGVSPGHFGQSHGRDRFDHGRIKEVAPLDGEPGDVVLEQGEDQEAEGADEPEFEVDEEEAHTVGVQRTPMLPSQSEIDEHNLTHLPFRDWCPFCIRGRGLSSGSSTHHFYRLLLLRRRNHQRYRFASAGCPRPANQVCVGASGAGQRN